MKKLALVGNTLKYAVITLLVYWGARIVLTLVFGYKLLSPEYAGPYFYCWREKYVDRRLATSSYQYIKPGSQEQHKILEEYVRYVQPEKDKSKLDSKKYAKIGKQIEELETGGDNAEKLAKLKEKHESMKDMKKRTEVTADGLVPLLSFSLDASCFSNSPRHWHVFVTDKENPDDTYALHKELDFFVFRASFVSYIQNLPTTTEEKMTELPILSEEEIAAYFDMNTIYSQESVDEHRYKLNFAHNGIAVDDATLATLNQTPDVMVYKRINPVFLRFVHLLKEKTGLVTFDEDTVNVDPELMGLLVEMTTMLFGGRLAQDQVEPEIKAFIYRISVLKQTASDANIMNRMYYYFLFNNLHIDPSASPETSEKYRTLYDSLEEQKNSEKPDMVRLKVMSKKLSAIRYGIIMNMFSILIARNLGTKGFVIGDDDRNIILRNLAYPYAFTDDKDLHNSALLEFVRSEAGV